MKNECPCGIFAADCTYHKPVVLTANEVEYQVVCSEWLAPYEFMTGLDSVFICGCRIYMELKTHSFLAPGYNLNGRPISKYKFNPGKLNENTGGFDV